MILQQKVVFSSIQTCKSVEHQRSNVRLQQNSTRSNTLHVVQPSALKFLWIYICSCYIGKNYCPCTTDHRV